MAPACDGFLHLLAREGVAHGVGALLVWYGVRDLLARAFAIKRAIAPELAVMPTTRARDIRPSKSAVV